MTEYRDKLGRRVYVKEITSDSGPRWFLIRELKSGLEDWVSWFGWDTPAEAIADLHKRVKRYGWKAIEEARDE